MSAETNTDTPSASKLGALLALFVSVGILLVGNGLQGTLLAVRGSIEHFSTDAIGLMQSGYFLGFVSGSLLGVRLIERAGHIRAFTAFASVASAATLAHLLLIDVIAWTAFRAVTGFCFAGLYLAIESWLNASADNTDRGRILSIYMVVNMLSLALGQLMLGLADPGGFILFCLISIIVSVGVVPVALTRTPAPTISKVEAMSLRKLFTISPLGVFGCAFYGLSISAFWGLTPVFANELKLQSEDIGLLMAVTIFGGFAAQWPIGHFSDRVDRRYVIAAVSIAAAVAAVGVGLVGGRSLWYLLGLSFLYGAMAFPTYSLVMAHVNDHISRDDMVQVSSSLLFIYGAGAIVGPAIAGFLMGLMGAPGLYYYMAAAFGMVGAFAVYRMTRRGPGPEVTQESFATVGVSTTEALQLDPRGPDTTSEGATAAPRT